MRLTKAEGSGFRAYAAVCTGVLALVVVVLVLLVAFGDLGLSDNGIAALFIGALLTTALAMVLMGLVFMSDRGGRDANVYEAGQRKSAGEDRRDGERGP